MKRGWVLDEVIRIGHIEAELSHLDEIVSDENLIDDSEKTSVEWLAALLYEERVEIMNRLLDITCAKSKYWCVLKHAAIDYVIACENQHAVRIDIAKASEQLALACSLFFGFAPMGCLRCFDEQINKGGEDGENNRP